MVPSNIRLERISFRGLADRHGAVKSRVFDLLGREVATLVHGMQPPGHHSVLFDGSNLPSGIYFYRLGTGDVLEAKKMVLLK